jgi:hypothetical protein
MCHQSDGSGIPRVFPSLATSSIVNGDLREMVNTVVMGKDRTAMQPFGLQLDQSQLASVISYVRSTYGKIETDQETLSQLVASAINELKIQEDANKKELQNQKNELNSISTPNDLFIKSYSYEKTDQDLAKYGYRLLIDKFPTSDLMLKAIDRLDKIDAR